MNRIIKILFLLIVVGVSYAKDTYTISGRVQTKAGETVKKGTVVLVSKADGSEVKKSKISKKGAFKLKKISPGKYQINALANGKASVSVSVVDDNIKDLIVIIKSPDEKKDVNLDKTTTIPSEQENNIQTLDTPLKTKKTEDLLPQVRPFDQVDKLQFEEQFFEYESNLRALKNQIDSLKSIVTAFENKQTMPNLSRELLDLIKIPKFQYRIELKNGTVVLGDIISETDSSLVLKTQIGELVLKKELVIR